MRPNIEFGDIAGLITQFKAKAAVVTLAGNLTLGVKSEPIQILDPGGAGRTVTLPPEADSKDLIFVIVNIADAAESLTVQDDTPTTVATVVGSVGGTANQAGIFHCDGTTWRTVLTSTRDVS